MPTPAAGAAAASQQRGHGAFDGGCLVLSGTVGPDRLNTPASAPSVFVCFDTVTSRTQEITSSSCLAWIGSLLPEAFVRGVICVVWLILEAKYELIHMVDVRAARLWKK